jgi:hypothetical protein
MFLYNQKITIYVRMRYYTEGLDLYMCKALELEVLHQVLDPHNAMHEMVLKKDPRR